MDTLVDTSGQAIARRILLERKTRKWSMSDLAGRSGVSKAAISKIERGEMSPTASVLVRLADAFGLTLAGLLIRAEHHDEAVQRAADQPLWEDPDSHYVRRQLFRSADNPIELARISLPAGAEVTLPMGGFDPVKEIVHVLEGTLNITDSGQTHTLGDGDSYGLSKTDAVTFANRGSQPCLYLIALARR
ncbi:MAG: helix-turn-helix domain-containing protein [Pseudomonadota bacterium]